MSTAATYIFAGGGTGGHLFPGIAVAEELLRRDVGTRVLFAGSERSLEREIVDQHGFEHAPLPSMPSSSWKRNPIRFAWNNWQAFRAARELLKSRAPSAVIGLGGFASAPVVVAAHRAQVPVVLLEQNVVPGRATRWLSRGADLVCVSFEKTVAKIPRSSRVIVTGNPVRSAIAALAEESTADSRTRGDIEPTLLVLGGSQGSQALNAAVLTTVGVLQDKFRGWRIIHQTGAHDAASTVRNYRDLGIAARVEPFLNDMVDCYRDASLAVARAGATTLAELACAGCPAILVPYLGAIGDHQTLNARAYESVEAAAVVQQSRDPQMTARALIGAIERILSHQQRLAQMRTAMRSKALPHAAGAVVDAILKLVNKESAA